MRAALSKALSQVSNDKFWGLWTNREDNGPAGAMSTFCESRQSNTRSESGHHMLQCLARTRSRDPRKEQDLDQGSTRWKRQPRRGHFTIVLRNWGKGTSTMGPPLISPSQAMIASHASVCTHTGPAFAVQWLCSDLGDYGPTVHVRRGHSLSQRAGGPRNRIMDGSFMRYCRTCQTTRPRVRMRNFGGRGVAARRRKEGRYVDWLLGWLVTVFFLSVSHHIIVPCSRPHQQHHHRCSPRHPPTL